jgi:16S rRNA (guanine527-N7)-methyltransferase
VGDPADDLRRTLAPRGFSGGQLEQFALVLHALEHDQHAPTNVRSTHEALETHLLDSLVGLDFDEIGSAGVVADLGSGAGFPGAALAIALPRARFRLIESQRRKCEFLQRLSDAAAIDNATVICARAEDWADGKDAVDAVVARALAPQPVVLEYAAPLLRLGGALVDWRGRRDAEEERAASAAAEALGLRRREIRRVQPFAQARDRHVHVFAKRADTPARYPRRAGIARKRPLGG